MPEYNFPDFVAVTYVFWLCQVVIHEVGQVVGARAAKLRLRSVILGRDRGPIRSVREISGVRVVLGIPTTGSVTAALDNRPRLLGRLRIFEAAGSLANLATAPLILSGSPLLDLFGLVGLVMAGINLAPLKYSRTSTRETDGRRLLHSRQTVHDWHAGAARRTAAEQCRALFDRWKLEGSTAVLPDIRAGADDPVDGEVFAVLVALASHEAGAIREDLGRISRHATASGLPATQRAMIANLVAWDLLCEPAEGASTDDPEIQATADTYSQRAVDLEPNNSSYVHTRAEVLLRLGRPEEALVFAEQAAHSLPMDVAPDHRKLVGATLAKARATTSQRAAMEGR